MELLPVRPQVAVIGVAWRLAIALEVGPGLEPELEPLMLLEKPVDQEGSCEAEIAAIGLEVEGAEAEAEPCSAEALQPQLLLFDPFPPVFRFLLRAYP